MPSAILSPWQELSHLILTRILLLTITVAVLHMKKIETQKLETLLPSQVSGRTRTYTWTVLGCRAQNLNRCTILLFTTICWKSVILAEVQNTKAGPWLSGIYTFIYSTNHNVKNSRDGPTVLYGS